MSLPFRRSRGLLSRRQLSRLHEAWWSSVGSVTGAMQTFPLSGKHDDARFRELLDTHIVYCAMVVEFSDALDWLEAL